ncbi:peptidase [Microcystis aeruginosa KW]|jgi:antirestriction protein ArdC|uniref:Peptidase n=2 Tax=Microcystis aeruginosa TaxID=1126 RepID=A0A1V4BYZ1_MICAE|nr:zincin-like metallopeptidase domain-containing protein [Rhizobium sp.]OPF19766.1 peptidase [Microcystis aeruginosa KW]
MMTDRQTKSDIYQTVTDRIVAAIEAGAPMFEMPWNRQSATTLPVNVHSKNAYRGVNILSLWVSQMKECYSSNIWGTYKQWQARGAQVRKGEKASLVVFYKEIEREVENDGDSKPGKLLLARASFVFNAEQVDGFSVPTPPVHEDKVEVIQSVADFVKATKAIVIHGGSKAYYRPRTDTIHIPQKALFKGTTTSTPTESYYSTLLHECVHWSGSETRLDRNLSNRFGDEAYAMEELIAELGAAFLCASLNITLDPRPDHAAYIDSWLKVLKSDKKAIFTAASQASQAVDYLYGLQPAMNAEAA